MFGRSNFAIVGLEPESLTNFQVNLNNKLALLQQSQYAASIVNRALGETTVGINPFGSPRKDETVVKGESAETPNDGVLLLMTTPEGEERVLDPAILEEATKYFGASEDEYSLGNGKYGFWVVINDQKDISHPASKKEQQAYSTFARPFKYLGKEDKGAVEAAVQVTAVTKRDQFPVIADFQHGRVYIEATSPDSIMAAREILSLLGATTFGLRWDFKTPTWITEFFSYIQENTHFTTEMQTRAEELTRFRPDEVMKLDDKMMEKIVTNFFSLSELGTGLWAGLSTPSRIKLHTTGEPISTSGVSSAFELLHKYDDAVVISAPVVFQELAVYTNKQGVEKQARYDLFTIDINDGINQQEVGAAMLKGFDLPRFKREVKKAMKVKNELTVAEFWSMWVQGMHDAILTFIENMTEALELEKGYGLTRLEEMEETEVGE
jgi:hypothetical protein